ncbi:MAG: patatin-like phospholipase family protein [Burkholderiales bacterium]
MKKKIVSLALQGGGPHGAFTWGVLDRLLEDERIEIEAISGASAGAVNAVVLAHGLTSGGREGARQALAALWDSVSSYANPASNGFLSLTHYFSPYQLNPLNVNPLRDIVANLVDFERIKSDSKIKLFIAATQVRTAKLRLFKNEELSLEALLASTCLPLLHQAVEIDGEPYWDGAFSANPAVFPLFYDCETPDVIIVLLHPLRRPDAPTTSAGISSRMAELSFSAPFLREMRAIALAKNYVENSHFPFTGLERRLARMNFHLIEAEELMTQLSVESKLDSSSSFLTMLRDHGRARAEIWLEKSFALVGERSSIRLRELFL